MAKAELSDDELRTGWDGGTLTPDQVVQALMRLFAYGREEAELVAYGSKPQVDGDIEGIA